MTRLRYILDKIKHGERLTNAERLERQGLIFNHDGKLRKIVTCKPKNKNQHSNIRWSVEMAMRRNCGAFRRGGSPCHSTGDWTP